MKTIPLTLFISIMLFGCSETTKNSAKAPEYKAEAYPHYSTEQSGENEVTNYNVSLGVAGTYRSLSSVIPYSPYPLIKSNIQNSEGYKPSPNNIALDLSKKA